MRKSFTDIFQTYLEPIDVKYSDIYLEEYESDKYREVDTDIQVWGFMFPESIRSIMTPDSVKHIGPLVSAINTCRNDGHNGTNGKRTKMKNHLATGRGKYFDDMYNHLNQMVENHAAARSMTEEYGGREIFKYRDITGKTIKNYIEKNNDSVNGHKADILRELSLLIREHLDWFSKGEIDKCITDELKVYIFEHIDSDPLKVMEILCLLSLFDEDDHCDAKTMDFYLKFSDHYCYPPLRNKDAIAESLRSGCKTVETEKLHHELTSTPVMFESEESVLFREKEVSSIADKLSDENTKGVMLCGFGGVGKSAIARFLFCTLKKGYDCCGWVSYHGDLRQSMISSFKIEDYSNETMTEADAKKKWNYIERMLSNNKQSKILVIDNVDFVDGLQDPGNDEDLRAISSWDNIKLIITSRLPKLFGYSIFPIENLGNANDCNRCIELFYHYNPEAETYRRENEEIVKLLVDMAGYNTMVIELIAKMSVYDAQDLGIFYDQLKQCGFHYADDVPVETAHSMDGATGKATDQGEYVFETASSQLMKLFNLRDRREIERRILWDFHCLPDNEYVTREELKNWMGYNLSDINSLREEGWIKYKGGSFFMHSLVQQSLSCNEDEKQQHIAHMEERRKEAGYKNTLPGMVESKTLFKKGDGFDVAVRKLCFSDYLTYGGRFLKPDALLYLADYARKKGVRVIGVKYYKKSYEMLKNSFSKKKEVGNKGQVATWQLWKSTYYYGYMLSYTRNGFDSAENLLQEAVEIAEKYVKKYPAEADITEELSDMNGVFMLGMSLDHLGYIISNDNKNDMNRMKYAEKLFNKAISIRKTVSTQCPESIGFLHDLAWSLDNLGNLYAMMNHERLIKAKEKDSAINVEKELNTSISRSEKYLKEALKIRRRIADIKCIKNDTEVAWTLCNLCSLLSGLPDRFQDAENYILESLSIYDNLDKEYPEQHSSSMARSYTSYARLLSKWEGRESDAIDKYEASIALNKKLENDYPGVYGKELAVIIAEETKFRERMERLRR